MQEEGDTDKKGRDGGQGVVDCKLGAQSLCHLASFHAQFLEKLILNLIVPALAKLLDGKDCSSGHSKRQGQKVQRKDGDGGHGGDLGFFVGFGTEAVVGSVNIFTKMPADGIQGFIVCFVNGDRSLGDISIVVNGKRSCCFVRDDKDKSAAIVVVLLEMFCVDACGGECGIS